MDHDTLRNNKLLEIHESSDAYVRRIFTDIKAAQSRSVRMEGEEECGEAEKSEAYNLSLAYSTLAEFLASILLSLAACHTYSLVETRVVEDCP